MTVNRTTLLNLPLPVTGKESGTWGDTTNNGLTQYMDIAIAGMSSLTSSDFTAGALTISNTTGNSSATNIANSSAQYSAIKVSSLAANSTITAPGSNRRYVIINADATYTLTIKASGQTGVTFQPGTSGFVAFNGTDYVIVGIVGPASATDNAIARFDSTTGRVIQNSVVTIADSTGNMAGVGSITSTSASGILTRAAATQDGVIMAGRAGGTSSYSVTLTPTTLAASRTFTLPDLTGTAATINNAQTFTAAQTFRAASAVRSEAASTQDAVVLAGRAGGTSSYAVTLTPTTLSASRTVTLADGDVTMTAGTMAVLGTAQTFTAAQTFRAASAIRSEAASTQDAIVLAGRAGGTSSYAVTLTPATLSASRTATLPDGGGNYTLGYLNVPAVGTKTGSYTLATADVGKYVQVGSGGSITIPDATFAEGDVISLFNNTSGNITITCSITTAYIAGTDSDKATMTLATRGIATVLFISSTVCVVSGNVS